MIRVILYVGFVAMIAAFAIHAGIAMYCMWHYPEMTQAQVFWLAVRYSGIPGAVGFLLSLVAIAMGEDVK